MITRRKLVQASVLLPFIGFIENLSFNKEESITLIPELDDWLKNQNKPVIIRCPINVSSEIGNKFFLKHLINNKNPKVSILKTHSKLGDYGQLSIPNHLNKYNFIQVELGGGCIFKQNYTASMFYNNFRAKVGKSKKLTICNFGDISIPNFILNWENQYGNF